MSCNGSSSPVLILALPSHTAALVTGREQRACPPSIDLIRSPIKPSAPPRKSAGLFVEINAARTPVLFPRGATCKQRGKARNMPKKPKKPNKSQESTLGPFAKAVSDIDADKPSADKPTEVERADLAGSAGRKATSAQGARATPLAVRAASWQPELSFVGCSVSRSAPQRRGVFSRAAYLGFPSQVDSRFGSR